MKIKLVVSDFHLGKGRTLSDGTQNILEDFIYDREFSEFLAYYSTGPYANAEVELILNGDILNLLQMDSWGVHTHLITERAVTRAVRKIAEGHPEFFSALRSFAAASQHSICYIVGNHDVGMLWPDPRQAFNEAVGTTVVFHDVAYEFDGVYVEHGQQYENFAAIDMKRPFITSGLPEPVLNLPWGSLFTALLLTHIKQQRPHVDKVRPFQVFLRWTLIHDFWWSIKAFILILKFTFDTLVFRSKYRVMEGVGVSIKMLKEISIYPNYDKIAFKVLEAKEDRHTVIFGHTHILRYRRWRKGKQYFNEGTWNEVTGLDLGEYGTKTRLTFASIEYPADSPGETPPRPFVHMKEWRGFWHPETAVLL